MVSAVLAERLRFKAPFLRSMVKVRQHTGSLVMDSLKVVLARAVLIKAMVLHLLHHNMPY